MKEKYNGFWKYIAVYMKEYQSKLVVTMVAACIVGVFVAIQPLIIKYIVDNGITNTLLTSKEKIEYVGIMCGVYIIIAALRIGVWRIGYSNMLKSMEGTLYNLRSHFFSHVQAMCMRFHEHTSVGELFNCIMGSPINNIKGYMNQMFIAVPYQVISLIISLIALLSYDWLLTLILFGTAVVMALCYVISRRRVRNLFREYIEVESEASHYLNDTLQGMAAIKLYSIEENTLGTFRDFIGKMYAKGVKATIKQVSESQKPEFVQYVGTAICYFVGAFSCIYRGVSVGVLYAFLSSMSNILGILINWMNLSLIKTSAEAGLHKILGILDTATSTPEKEQERTRSVEIERERAVKNNKPCISFCDVSFGYDYRTIFENLNCDINYNESVALVGSSGSGKSTLTKLIMRLYDVNSGVIKLHDCDLREFGLHDMRASIGVVPQNPFIFYGSIWDNVKIARPNASNKEIIDAMEIARVHEFVNELEKGWNTIVGDGALDLSGGQKQRIAIARAVLGNPDILIFDEATSALDNISERHIQQAMEDLMKAHTVIIVAHRLSTIKNVDRIMVFDSGKIVEEGSYDELAKKGGVFSELLNM